MCSISHLIGIERDDKLLSPSRQPRRLREDEQTKFGNSLESQTTSVPRATSGFAVMLSAVGKPQPPRRGCRNR